MANFSYVSFENASNCLHARQGSPPTRGTCLLARGTWLGGVAFCHVNGSSRAISANRGEINRENMAAQSEYFRSCYLPVLSAEQNHSQSEEINVIDESQAEHRHAWSWNKMEKRFLGRPFWMMYSNVNIIAQ